MNRVYESFCSNNSNRRTFEATFEDVTKPISKMERIKNQWKEKCLFLTEKSNSAIFRRLGKIAQTAGTVLGICGIAVAVRGGGLSTAIGTVLAGFLFLLNLPLCKILHS